MLLGSVLWWLLPGSVETALCLSQEERRALLAEMERYRLADEHGAAVQQPGEQGAGADSDAAPAKGSSGSSLEGGKDAGEATPAQAAAPRRRTLADDWASLQLALRCALVWCAGTWRMLYAMAGGWGRGGVVSWWVGE